MLLQGSVEVHRGDGFSTKIADLKPGDIFGEIGYLSKRARTTSIIAGGKDVITLKLGRDLGRLLLDFIREDPKPWIWPERPLLSPWDLPTCVDPDDGIDLPLFAP